MKILFIKNWIHPKNLNSIQSYKNVNFTIINNISEISNYDLKTFDCVFSPSEPIDISLYPNTKFIFGPHFDVLPSNKLKMIKGKNAVLNLLCDYIIDIWKSFEISNGVQMVSLPFSVDSEKFKNNKTIDQREKVFIYFKNRKKEELEYIKSKLSEKNISYKLFNYKSGYIENDYLSFLQESKYGIWIGSHESQGFALLESLSCDVPLLVWNVKYLNQEVGSKYYPYLASSIPNWDTQCGEYFYEKDEFDEKFNKLVSNINNYKPREYIIKNFSTKVMENKLIDLVNSINITNELIFDIGANIGNWSLKNYSSDKQIIAVEAVPETFNKLIQNIGKDKNIICINYAVSNSSQEEITFYKAKADTLSTLNLDWLTSPSSRFGGMNYDIIKCKTITIDNLIEKYGKPNLIKIDTEGGEYICVQSLNQKVDNLCFEWASETNDITFKTLDHLVKLGFNKFYLQNGDEYTFRPIEYYDIDHIKKLLLNTKPKIDWGMLWCK